MIPTNATPKTPGIAPTVLVIPCTQNLCVSVDSQSN